jgi:hypothetical protein
MRSTTASLADDGRRPGSARSRRRACSARWNPRTCAPSSAPWLPAALLMREFRASDRLWGRATGLVSEEIKSLGFTSLNLARFHKWSMKYLNF